MLLGDLIEHGFVPLLKLLMQLLVDLIDFLTLPGQSKIDFFLVVRLLVAFNPPFFDQLPRQLRDGASPHV
ncbi:hypothetical protein D3C76_1877420 [compost metagenome]